LIAFHFFFKVIVIFILKKLYQTVAAENDWCVISVDTPPLSVILRAGFGHVVITPIEILDVERAQVPPVGPGT